MSPHLHPRKPIHRIISFLASIVTQCLSPGASDSSTLIGRPSQISVTTSREDPIHLHEAHGGERGKITIDTLPDDALLEIFDFYVDGAQSIDAWRTLVHVCIRWRDVVSASARRLNLRLLCTEQIPMKDMIEAWPALPIVVTNGWDTASLGWDAGNIITALGYSSRVSEISLPYLTSTLLRRVAAVAQVPFPALTSLELSPTDETAAVLPDLFLGGSAPRLQNLDFYNVPFPALPKLLSSATHLVCLRILGVPNSAYISPEAMATCLSVMTSLETFHLGFRSPRPPPDQASRHPPPLTRTILPALYCFSFRGNSEYLDDLVAQIDAPLLDDVTVTLFNQLVFDTPQFMQFIGRISQFNTLDQADVLFHDDYIKVKFSSRRLRADCKTLVLVVKCGDSDWQLSALAQVFRTPSPPICTLERLDIFDSQYPPKRWQDDTEDAQWLEFLHPFTSVKRLYLSEEVSRRVAPALKKLVGGRVTEVLPVLENIFASGLQPEGRVQKALGRFAAARQVSGHSVAVQHY